MVSVRWTAGAALAGCAALWAAAAMGQVFRSVGPDGRVTFSDRPPVDGGKATPANSVTMGGADTGSGTAGLPSDLRNATSRYPVTLYTGRDCVPCNAARNFLVQRGVPFSERTVTSEEDVASLEKLSGAARLPFGTIGSQHLRGFSEAEWGQYLDAAGYPKQSQLPRGFRNAPPTPLVAVQPAAAPPQATAQESAPRPAVPAAPVEEPSNPAGIRF